MGDISSRRGSILGTDSLGDARGTRVRAVVPQAELHLYATDLHSMTHGRGTFVRRFHGYEQMPGDAAQKVIEESAKTKKASSPRCSETEWAGIQEFQGSEPLIRQGSRALTP
jgi:elongation factor G